MIISQAGPIFTSFEDLRPGDVVLHKHAGENVAVDRPVLFFIHGLQGGGYTTWDGTLNRLFAGSTERDGLDIAIFNFTSGLKRAARKSSGDVASWVRLIEQAINDLAKVSGYREIFIVGHSLGGILAGQAVKNFLQDLNTGRAFTTGPLVGLVSCASPRAGSRWALRPFARFLPETRVLVPLNDDLADTHDWMKSKVHNSVYGEVPSDRIWLPMYTLFAESDKLVSRFSATFDIPKDQNRSAAGSHTDVVKADREETEIIDLLGRRIIEDLRYRRRSMEQAQRAEQAARLRQDTASRPRILIEGYRRNEVVAKLWTDTAGWRWRGIYTSIAEALSTSDVRVLEASYSDGPVDLDLAVLTSERAIAIPESTHWMLFRSCEEQAASSTRDLTVTPVGPNASDAEQSITSWLESNAPTVRANVLTAADDRGFAEVLSGLLRVVIKGKLLGSRRSSPTTFSSENAFVSFDDEEF